MLNLIRKLASRIVGTHEISKLPALEQGDILVVKGQNPEMAVSLAYQLGNAELAPFAVPIIAIGKQVSVDTLKNMPDEFLDQLREALNAVAE